MFAVLQWLAVLAAVVALGWAVVKCDEVIAEAFGFTIQRQLRKGAIYGVCAIAVFFTLMLGAITLSAALWGTRCEPVLDPMSCPSES
jgi:hypothetical protein